MKNRIAFFISDYIFGSSIHLVDLIRYFRSKEYFIDVFLNSTIHNNLVSFKFDEKINIYSFGQNIHEIIREKETKNNFKNKIKKILKSIGLVGLTEFIIQFKYNLKWLIKPFIIKNEYLYIPKNVQQSTRDIVKKNNYKCFIGIEPQGLIFAGEINEKLNVPLIYVSLELYLKEDKRLKNRFYKVLKKLEKKYHRKSGATIIQDDERAELLFRSNNLKINNVHYVPVSILGPTYKIKGKYFHKKYNIPEDYKLILNWGSIVSDHYCKEISEIANKLSEKWFIVFHGYSHEKKLIDSIQTIDINKKIFISMELVDDNMINEVVSSCDIGLVFYKNLGMNEYLTANASTKMAVYTRCGLPVVTIDFPGFKDIINQFKCGQFVNNFHEIPSVISKIENNYSFYRNNSFNCFAEKYDLEKNMNSVEKYIRNLN